MTEEEEKAAQLYRLSRHSLYEPRFESGGKVQGTGIILTYESAARFSAYYVRRNDPGSLFFQEVENRHII